MPRDPREQVVGTIPKVVEETDQESIAREDAEPSIQLFGVAASREIRPVLVGAGDRRRFPYESCLFALEAVRLGGDRGVEVE